MRCTRCRFKLLASATVLLAICAAAQAQGLTYHAGRNPSAEEIRAWDISVNPDGKDLPPGSGTAKEGAEIYAKKCGLCHGPTGVEGDNPAAGYMGRPGRLVGAKGNEGLRGWMYATPLWHFIKRAMPPVAPMAAGSLSAEEVYAVTAYLLYRNGIVKESDVMDAKSLPAVPMPRRLQEDSLPKMRVYPAVQSR